MSDAPKTGMECMMNAAPTIEEILKSQLVEIARLNAEVDSFHMAYRMKCDEETKAQAAELTRLRAENEALREAANAVIERWDTPLWKDAEPTARVINRLRAALREGQ